jgi:2-amino-4-hydroxy-6-hydroxymethyldihydropteridine diphosphokinase
VVKKTVEVISVAYVFVSIGSNINRYQSVSASLDRLRLSFGELLISPVYESDAVGFEGSNFLNLVVGFSCAESIGQLSRILHQIEDDNGRRRDGPKFGPRTLDIDILTYDDCIGDIDGVQLPRDEITKNAFVLLPLKDIAAAAIHPVEQKSYLELWKAYDQASQKLWAVAFDWDGRAISQAER